MGGRELVAIVGAPSLDPHSSHGVHGMDAGAGDGALTMNDTLSLANDLDRGIEVTRSLARSARRVGKTGLFVAETLLHAATESHRDSCALDRAQHCAWVAENICTLHGIQVVEHGRPLPTPAIYVANHVSYIEPIALLAKIPGAAIAKREVAHWPVVGDALRALGTLFVDRASASSGAIVLREAWRRLDHGANIVVFPEGTTTEGRDVLPFRRGVFGLAQLAGVPIVPVAVRYDQPDAAWIGDDAFAPHYFRTTSRPRTRVFLTYDEPIIPSRTDLDAYGLAELSRRRIRALLAS